MVQASVREEVCGGEGRFRIEIGVGDVYGGVPRLERIFDSHEVVGHARA
jgi:hypothetical protein